MVVRLAHSQPPEDGLRKVQWAARAPWFAGIALAVLLGPASARAQGRGEWLYVSHCGACHTAQIHWRAARAVTDWTSQEAQVRKWQDVSALGWTDPDITEVARYLNDNTYHFEQTVGSVSGSAPVAAAGRP